MPVEDYSMIACVTVIVLDNQVVTIRCATETCIYIPFELGISKIKSSQDFFILSSKGPRSCIQFTLLHRLDFLKLKLKSLNVPVFIMNDDVIINFKNGKIWNCVKLIMD